MGKKLLFVKYVARKFQVMTFGQGDIGQLGLGDDIDERKKPSPVGGALEGLKVVQVVCGGMHTVALTDQGKVGMYRGKV